MFKFFGLSPRGIVIACAVLLVVLVGWRYRNTDFVQAFFHSDSGPHKSIQFNNDPPKALAPSLPEGNHAEHSIKGVHKCLQHGTVTYDERECPEGAKELATDKGSLMVVPHLESGGDRTRESKPPQDFKNSPLDPT